jgi:hypothetical protein
MTPLPPLSSADLEALIAQFLEALKTNRFELRTRILRELGVRPSD